MPFPNNLQATQGLSPGLMELGGGLMLGGGLANAFFGNKTEDLRSALSSYDTSMNNLRSSFNQDWNSLMSNFDTSMLGLRQESKQLRQQASSDMKQGLQKDTDDFVKGLGPLNPQTEATIRTQMTLPVSRKILEFDLGTTDQDLSLGMSALMGGIQLEREGHAMNQNLNQAQYRNENIVNMLINQQPGFLGRFLQGL